ncbi:protein set domain group 41 [Phtheirospermum japonicum]|uniref:Protein set domain group 41 n=1 Tax=Phtheirospermum japonicum TaxID=374723 RepID=A0A830B574_9LAMI|nr:protein set domain group 41 [Phtheirospermum japonicum]
MEMRAIEDIAIGQELTPPLRSLAAVLRDSAVTSHCYACFSILPAQPYPPSNPAFPQNPNHVPDDDTSTPLYCSPTCSSYDSPLHLSSGEAHLLQSPPSTWNDDSSDLRLSLRLLSIFQKLPKNYSFFPRFQGLMSSDHRLLIGGNKHRPFQEIDNVESPADYLPKNNEAPQNDVVVERIAGLMTNREKLLSFEQNRNNPDEDNENICQMIKEGAKLIAKARRVCLEKQYDDFVLGEMVLCLVLTNAVEVQDKSGHSIGVAVYDSAFSWINHSCSPNACYRFFVGPDEDNEQLPLRITPAAENGYGNNNASKLFTVGVEKNGYGPRIVVRSIKDVKKGEEVTIAYTDLLQPKEMRQAELWSKYQFSCSCKRCDTLPANYVDNALQAINPDKVDKLMQSFDDAITDYLSSDDPISCCKKLENLFIHGSLIEPKSPQKPKLHIFHHLSLNAYTTLASAYKVRANDLLALNYEVERQNLEAFNMHKTSVAYSLLLAGGAHHLFTFESALIATAASFWTNAGESILGFARSPLWDSFLSRSLTRMDLSSVLENYMFSETLRSDDAECNEQARMNLVLLGEHCLRSLILLLQYRTVHVESQRHKKDVLGTNKRESVFYLNY